jgi:hypothetical protein
MTKKIKVKNGNMSIEVDETSKTIFTDILDSLPGDTIKILQQTTEDIYKDAYAVWPVQKPITTQNLTEEGKVRTTARNINKQDKAAYSLKRAFAASYKMQKLGILQIPEFSIKSKGSKDKLYTGFVFSGDSIEAVVGNTAPYAWAIKVGVDTDLPYALGTRVSNELLWKPAKKQADSVAEKMADAATDIAKKVK